MPVVAPPSTVVSPVRAAYVHIPFCRRRCYYCDFPISVLGDRLRGEASGTVTQYVDWLCQEIGATPSGSGPLSTVFFGGGTPSLLSVEQLGRILAALADRFGLEAQAEISMEMDPGTFDLAQIQGYCHWGVNRVSLGVQAFQTPLLQACGRTHTAADIDQAVRLLAEAGVTNVSLDLISGLPGQTEADWRESLACAIALSPQHLSVYDLTIESETAFGRWYQPGSAPLPSDDHTAAFYRLAQATLTAAGYDHYEISNYAQPGYYCRHNQVYWHNQPHYGFGMGATSYLGHRRVSRPRTLRAYYQWLETYISTPEQAEEPLVSSTERLLDTLMVGLRLATGVNLSQLQREFGAQPVQRVQAVLSRYVNANWVRFAPDAAGDTWVCLQDPDGFLFSNVVLVALFKAFF